MAHSVDLAFLVAVAGWLWYVRRLSRGFYFWSDDLHVIQQAGSWDRLLKPYNQALSLMSLLIDRTSAELGHLSFTPFLVAGALSLVAVPVSYFFTTRRQFGPPLAAILAMPLLWFHGMNLRPAGLNHFLALVGGIFCAAALNRGRRADGVLAGALLFSLCSAGGGLVVAGACLVHNALVRPPLRRWLAVLVPLSLYGLWWLVAHPRATAADSLSVWHTARIVRNLFLAPFYQVGFGLWPLAAILLAAFLLWGALQLRGGLVAGANFLAWTAAMVAWAISLVQSRGTLADPATFPTFRYAYLSLGFGLLALVPRQPIRWPRGLSVTNRIWLAVAAIIVLAFAGVRAQDARGSLQGFAAQNAELGRKAKGTMLVLRLGPGVIPDSTPIRFFGFGNPHGTAGQARALMDRYGSPFDANPHTIDQILVDQHIVDSRILGRRSNPPCLPLAKPLELAPTSFRENELGAPVPSFITEIPGPLAYQLWSPKAFTIEVRRFGDHWVRWRGVPASTDMVLTLPVLNTPKPWQIRADGACLIPYGSTFGRG